MDLGKGIKEYLKGKLCSRVYREKKWTRKQKSGILVTLDKLTKNARYKRKKKKRPSKQKEIRKKGRAAPYEPQDILKDKES